MNENEPKPITIKNWQFVASVVVYVILATLAFATVRAETEENSSKIKEMRNEMVGRREFEEMRDDMRARLTRIEDKLDEEKRLRALDEAYYPSTPRHK